MAEKINILLRAIPAIVICIILSVASLTAQSESDNYKLQVGNVVWGGGVSTAENLTVTGTVPYQGAGHSASRDQVITGGVIANLYSNGNTFLASYIGRQIDTVTIVDRRLEVIYGGDTGTVTGAINYRLSGQKAYTAVALQPTGGDTLFYDLNSDLITLRGLEFYFELHRNNKTVLLGDSTHPSIFITEVTKSQGMRPESLPETTYAMISIPIDISGENETAEIFLEDLGQYDPTFWRLGHFDSRGDSVIEYPNTPDVIPGRSYWLITRYTSTYGAAGVTVMPNLTYQDRSYYEVPLERGWNQLANPFAFPINWGSVLFSYDGSVIGHDTLLIDNIAYLFTGTAYTSASILRPWDGFFVFIKKDGVTIMFPYEDALEKKNSYSTGLAQSETPAFDWALQIALEANGFIDDGNFIGTRADATVGADWFDLADPPPPPGKPRLAFKLPDGERYLRRYDIRPPVEDGAVWDIDILNTSGCRLSITDIITLPENLQVWLTLDIGTVIPLTKDTTVYIADNIRGARLIVGNSDYVEKEITPLIPKNYALYQNYPNPFNPETSIRFALPEAGLVKIEIFNILGQKVTTLLDRDMPAGVNEVVWNGAGDTGRNISTGVYFYRLTSGAFVQSKKMILLK